MFGNHADTYSGDSDFPVIALKGVKVSDYGGRTLSLLSSSNVQINPDIQQAHAVRGWYDATVRTAPGGVYAFRTYDSSGAGGAGGSGAIRPDDPFKYIGQIKDENLGMGDKPDYLNVRGTIAFVKTENIAYTACPTEGCNKKVNQEGDNAWRCEKCQKTHPNCSYR
jgi:replication factor A1